MKLKLLAIGKMKQWAFAELAEDYAKRIQKLHPFEVQEIPEKSYRDPKRIENLLEKEARLINKRCKPGTFLVALDEKGKEFSSVALSREIKKLLESPAQEIVFVVGGAYGLADALKKDAKLLWSLSKLTLPHQLARVLTLEQIYRGLTLLKNVPYHHD